MEKREHSLDVLQDRVMKLKVYAKLQKTPLQMQVNAIKRKNKYIYCTSIIATKYHFLLCYLHAPNG